MSLYREVEFKCVIKSEYREFFQLVIMENNLEYTSDEKIINDFMEEMIYFCERYEKLLNIIKHVNVQGAELPIYNEDTGESAMFIEYNMHNSLIRQMVYAFEDGLLPYIAEGKIDYLRSWSELDYIGVL
jgi:hypothetical protein